MSDSSLADGRGDQGFSEQAGKPGEMTLQ